MTIEKLNIFGDKKTNDPEYQLSKMIAKNLYNAHFINRYGEKWKFKYDPIKKEGILCGSDVGWREYPVVEGQVPGLILNDEEIRWLRKVWTEAIARK